MIRNARQLEDGALIRADVGVIGAGPVGIDLARYLARHGVTVALIEGGRIGFDPDAQALTRVDFAGKPLRTPETDGDMSGFLPPLYRGHCRVRQFGGTSTIWTGKWSQFDELDFAVRSWIPNSGWPIAHAELRPYYDEVARDYSLGDFAAEEGGPAFAEAERLLAPAGLRVSPFYWESSPLRAGGRYALEVAQTSRIDAVLGVNATEIELTDNRAAVSRVRCRTLDGRTLGLMAEQIILATGGLEAPRLLLASNRQIPEGIGNGRDLVGRFFMDHPKHMRGRLIPGPTLRRLAWGLRTRPRPRFGIRFALDEGTQAAEELLHHALYLRPHPGLLAERRPYGVKLALEQAPNRESRLTLGRERDALGMPRLVVDWRFTELDHANLAALQPRLVAAFERAGLGRLDLGRTPLTLDAMTDASHHMGATRMARDSSRGVVDPDCRVFGVANLYIAASSVFPTGHAYSPTFTLLALGRRLGVHLLSRRAASGFSAARRPVQAEGAMTA